MAIDLAGIFDELDGRIEDRTFDMKLDLPKVDDVVKEIQGGMNGLESLYRIVIGVDEGHDKKFRTENIAPIKWPVGKGVLNNLDAYRNAIDSAVRSNTSDYHEGFWNIDEISVDGGCILIVQVIKSPFGPHQNKKDRRYYIRRAGNTSHMVHSEIRKAITDKDVEQDKMYISRPALDGNHFLADLRDHKYVREARELRYSGGPQLHVQVFPLDYKKNCFSPATIARAVHHFFPLGRHRQASSERVQDGFLAWRVESADKEKTGGISKIFTTGEIWGVDNSLLAGVKNGPANIPACIVGEIRKGILQYAEILKGKLCANDPYKVNINLYGIRNAKMHVTSHGNDGKSLQDSLYFSSLWNRNTDSNAEQLCNEFASQLWDTCGLELKERIRF